MSLRVSYKRQTLLMILLVIVLFAAIEITLKVYDYFNPRCDFMKNPLSAHVNYELKKQICDMWRNHLVHIDPTSGISQNIPNQHFPTMNINSHGFRGPAISQEKPEDTFRIFVVGGSTTFGIRALSDDQTIPGHLQTNFDKSNYNKKIKVVNAGIDAITSTDELQLIKAKIVDFQPDLIIIYDGHNDVANKPGKIKPQRNDDIFEHVWKKYLTFYDTPFVIGGIVSKAKEPVQSFLFNTQEEDKAAIWKQNMIEICNLGQQNGFKTLIFLQPFLGTGNKTLTDFEKELYEFHFRDKLLQGYQLFAYELNDLDNYCTGTVDLRFAFDDINESVYFDGAHVGSDHNKIIADKIFDVASSLVE